MLFRSLIVDFAPHDFEELRDLHAHRRLGISSEHMTSWLARAGLNLIKHEVLPPPYVKARMGLTVSLWLAENGNVSQIGGHTKIDVGIEQ